MMTKTLNRFAALHKKDQLNISMECKQQLAALRHNIKCSTRDIATLISGRIDIDYTAAHQTNLYNLHGGEYCELLPIVNDVISKYNLTEDHQCI